MRNWLVPSGMSLQLEVTICPYGPPLLYAPQTVTGPKQNGLDPSRLPMKIHTVCSASLDGEPDMEFSGAQGRGRLAVCLMHYEE